MNKYSIKVCKVKKICHCIDNYNQNLADFKGFNMKNYRINKHKNHSTHHFFNIYYINAIKINYIYFESVHFILGQVPVPEPNFIRF